MKERFIYRECRQGPETHRLGRSLQIENHDQREQVDWAAVPCLPALAL